MSHIQNGWPEKVEAYLKPYHRRQEALSVNNGCNLIGDRVAIPASLREKAAQTLHMGHAGTICMKTLARSLVFWPKMDQQVEEIVKKTAAAVSFLSRLKLCFCALSKPHKVQ